MKKCIRCKSTVLVANYKDGPLCIDCLVTLANAGTPPEHVMAASKERTRKVLNAWTDGYDFGKAEAFRIGIAIGIAAAVAVYAILHEFAGVG